MKDKYQSESSGRRLIFASAAIVSLYTMIVFTAALKNDFVAFDDNMYVYENPYLQHPFLKLLKWAFFGFHALNYHPLTLLSHAMDYAIWGLAPMGHHLTNIILHSIDTFLVVMLIALLLKRANLPDMRILTASAVTGILFGIHPLHVESVAWVSERKDVLYALFYLLGILSYLRYVTMASRKWYALTLILFSLSLMSKPMAVTFPVVLLIIDWHPLGRFKKTGAGPLLLGARPLLLEKLPFFSLSIISSALTLAAQYMNEAVVPVKVIPFSVRILVGIKALASYMVKMLIPERLLPYYPYPSKLSLMSPEYIIPVLFVASATAFSLAIARKQKIWLALWAYYLISLFPVLGIVQVGNQFMADRYMYLPSLGPFLLAGTAIAVFAERASSFRRKAGSVFLVLSFVALTGVLSYLTVNQIKIWKNSEVLWNTVIEAEPEVPVAYNNLGVIYMNKGMTDKAIALYRKAVRVLPDYASAYNNLGIAYNIKGQKDIAIEFFKKSVTLKPDFAEAYNNLGSVYNAKGMRYEALKCFQKAVGLRPDFAEAYNNLGSVYGTMDTDMAIEYFNAALALKPDLEGAYYNLAMAYSSKGLTDKAAEYFRIAEKLRHKHNAKNR